MLGYERFLLPAKWLAQAAHNSRKTGMRGGHLWL
jgi:hypothetical protein